MTGIIEEYTMQDGLFVAKATQDADPIMDANAAERNSGVNDDRKSEMRKVASIPLLVVEQLKTRPMSEGGPIDLNLLGVDLEHTLRFNRWLNDRDNRNFRTNNSRQ
jgi:hypothetical protein